MRKIKLTKLQGEKSHEGSLEAGMSTEGIIEKEWMFPQIPTIGKAFVIGASTPHSGYRTSQVQEILSPNTFRTHNSEYKWEEIQL